MKIRCDGCNKEYDGELITKNTIGYIIYYFCEKCQERLEDWVDREYHEDCSDTLKIIRGKIEEIKRIIFYGK